MLKKLSITITLFIIIAANSYSQKINSFFADETLFGKIKQVTERTYQYKYIEKDKYSNSAGGYYVADSLIKTVRNYDTTGNIVSNIVYVAAHNLYTHEHDHITYFIKKDSKGIITDAYSYTTFKNGIYKFNEKGYMIEFDLYEPADKLISKSVYQYDKKDNIIDNKYFNAKDSLLFEKKFKRDRKGNVTEEDNYKNDGKFNYYVGYTFDFIDKMGNWLKRTRSGQFKTGNRIGSFVTERQIIYY